MKISVCHFNTGKIEKHEEIESVQIRSKDSCVVVTFKNGGFKLFDMEEGKKDILIENE